MKTIWFTGDHHFGHKNIISHAQRPFTSVEQMDKYMIERWNERVKPDDEVYHLGDVGLCSPSRLREILSSIHGKIFLIRGNHETSAESCHQRFEWIKDYYELKIPDTEAYDGERSIILLHYAMRVWNASHHGSWHVYGHSHGQLPDDITSLSIDVGVDCHGFAPISYDDVKALMSQKKWRPIHEQRDQELKVK